jgi:hypothetical protein
MAVHLTCIVKDGKSIMSTMAMPVLETVKQAILEKLGQQSLRPSELIQQLAEFDDVEVRQALSLLNQDGRIELKPDRRLSVVEAA